MSVNVQVLGPVEVSSGAERLSSGVLASAQVRLVLTALAVTPAGLPREALAEVLWGDDLPSSADAALRNVLSKVRRLLLPLPQVDLREEQGVLRLALPDSAGVDLVEARRDLAEAEDLLARGDLDDALLRARTSLDLFDRPFLAGVHTPWAEQVRHDLHEAAVRAHVLLARLHLERGDAAEAVEVASQVLRRAPLHEGAHELLVRAHIRSGNRALALQSYAHCRRVLDEHLGTAPGARLEALHLSLLQDDEAPSPALQIGSVQRRLSRIRHEEHLAGLEARREVVDVDTPATERLDLLIELGRARWGSHQPAAQVLEVALVAGHLALGTGSARHAGQALDLLATSTGVGRRQQEVERLGAAARTRWPDRADVEARVLVLRAELGDGAAAVHDAESAVVAARRSGEPAVLLDALLTLDRSLAWTPDLPRREALADECTALLAAGVPRWRERPTYEPATRAQRGDRHWIAAQAREQQALADRTGHWEPAFYALAYRATTALLDGDLSRAGTLADELFADTRDDVNAVNTATALQMALVRERGGLEDLLPALADVVAANPTVGAFAAAQVSALVLTRRYGPAREALRTWVDGGLPRVERDLVFLLCLGTLAEAVGLLALEDPRAEDRTAAGILLHELAPYTGQVCAGAHGVVSLCSVDSLRGVLHLARGERPEAAVALRAGLALEQRMRAPLLAARTRGWLSRALGPDDPQTHALRDAARAVASLPGRRGLADVLHRTSAPPE